RWRTPQAIGANARRVDECGRRRGIGSGLADQRFRPNQVVFGREHDRAVPHPGDRALWIVTARGKAVITDLSDGALVPQPAGPGPELLVVTPGIVVAAVAGHVRVHRVQSRKRRSAPHRPYGAVATAVVR